MFDHMMYVFLPCYNESENIRPLVEEWEKRKTDFEKRGYELKIICIDDRSTDNTYSIIKHLSQELDNVKVLRHKRNLGLGGVIRNAFKVFTDKGNPGDIMFLMDGDNTHDPVYSINMLEKHFDGGYDCVIASRYCNKSDVVGVPGVRRFLSDGARIYYKMVLRVKGVEDYTCGYRLYTYDIVKKAQSKYGVELVKQMDFSCMMEVLYKLYKVGARFAEVPFKLRYDKKGGESKMKIIKTVKNSLLVALKLKLRVK